MPLQWPNTVRRRKPNENAPRAKVGQICNLQFRNTSPQSQFEPRQAHQSLDEAYSHQDIQDTAKWLKDELQAWN